MMRGVLDGCIPGLPGLALRGKPRADAHLTLSRRKRRKFCGNSAISKSAPKSRTVCRPSGTWRKPPRGFNAPSTSSWPGPLPMKRVSGCKVVARLGDGRPGHRPARRRRAGTEGAPSLGRPRRAGQASLLRTCPRPRERQAKEHRAASQGLSIRETHSGQAPRGGGQVGESLARWGGAEIGTLGSALLGPTGLHSSPKSLQPRSGRHTATKITLRSRPANIPLDLATFSTEGSIVLQRTPPMPPAPCPGQQPFKTEREASHIRLLPSSQLSLGMEVGSCLGHWPLGRPWGEAWDLPTLGRC